MNDSLLVRINLPSKSEHFDYRTRKQT